MKKINIISTVVQRTKSGKKIPTGNTIIVQGGGTVDVEDLKKELEKYFLSDDKDDAAKGVIDFIEGLKVKGVKVSFIIDSESEFEGEDDALYTALKSNNIFLRKDKNDRSTGTIASDKGFEVGEFKEGTLGSGGAMYSKDGNTYIEADFLKIRKKAAFTSITIQELKHVGGEIILSPAALICSKVENLSDGWKCYFNTEDSDGRKVYQEFVLGDQARCQTFNLSPNGANDLLGNHYYWRLVVGVGEDYIILSKTDCDTNSEDPREGDNIAQLGNRNDKQRQAAIILSAFGEDAPSYKQYNGIDGFSLDKKQVTKLSPFGNELTGILNIEAGSTGVKNLKDFPDEVYNAVQVGSVNLLRNSGFTGNYKTEELNSSYNLSPMSELYSDSLKNWFGVASVYDDLDAVSGKSVEIGSISQEVYTIKDESYVVSFKAKGTEIAVSCGGYNHIELLTSEYKRYEFKFKADGIGSFILSGTAKVCDIQLERGTIATDWKPSPYDNDKSFAEFQALKYIQDAIQEGDTTILGGLILSSMIQLGNYKDGKMQKVNAGMSGIYNDEDDVAFWGGGTFEQAIKTLVKFKQNPNYQPSENEWQKMANFVVSHGGDLFLRGTIFADNGYFRGELNQNNGSTLLNKDGSGQLSNGALSWNKYGTIYRKSHENIVWVRILDEFDESRVIDLTKGTYLDLTSDISMPTFVLPSSEYDGVTISLRWGPSSRSNTCAVLKGNFQFFQKTDEGYKMTRASELTLDDDMKEFQLAYDLDDKVWLYRGNGVRLEGDRIVLGNVVESSKDVNADKITANKFVSSGKNGITTSVSFIAGTERHTLTFTSGLLTGYDTIYIGDSNSN